MNKENLIGIDLFAGAGGLSLGAKEAGIDIQIAVEKDTSACATYRRNHPNVEVIQEDIRKIPSSTFKKMLAKSLPKIVFGGPPCGGFSTTNQRTRSPDNPGNWLYRDFVRVARALRPQWVVLENVPGLRNTSGGLFFHDILNLLTVSGYRTSSLVLDSSDFGVPQCRKRLFIIGTSQDLPLPKFDLSPSPKITVRQALWDLPTLENGASETDLPYRSEPHSLYARAMRGCLKSSTNHLVTRSAPHVLARFPHVPQGGNWENVPRDLFEDYSSFRCHTSLYRRLREDLPSRIIGNYRKNLLIHPTQERGLSVREAARLQSFPDSYVFEGSIGFQQQQVGNAVPPHLARAVFESICNTLEGNA